MRLEDLKGWLQEASGEKNPAIRRWRLLMRIIQKKFNDGVVPEEVAWVTMVSYQKLWGVIGV